ncbi:VOC family protein [Ornithinimicrobium avium]|uniref:VOC family protein n=1 Tax=Ornithinimicrobium avium TaxID=2283195 RepID=A0A345NPU9_9MICO|nr:VOC family protein [Ornithinimicrobium avium]AXH97057.1 VOC family protein [Ornithinimicrobium avium]
MSTYLTGVRNVAIYVQDPDRARIFYEGLLGLTFISERARRIQLAVGETRLLISPTHVDEQDATEALHGRCEGYFEVVDVVDLVARLRREGVPVTQEPTDEPWGERDAVALDPDGFPVFLTQRAS